MSALLKTLSRIVLILLLASVVSAGVTYLGAHGLIGQQGGGRDFADAAQTGFTTLQTSFHADSGGERGGTGGAFSLLGILQNLLKVGGITLVVVFIQKILAKFFRKPRTLTAA
jgi:hypothetical protein